MRIEDEPKQSGFIGWYEDLLRKNQESIHALTLIPIYLLIIALLSVDFLPALLFFRWITQALSSTPTFQYFGIAIGLAGGLFISGFFLIAIVPLINLPVRFFVRPARGFYYSTRFIGWYIHNALTYLVRYTFLEFITPTPFNLLYFRGMGMKIGSRVQINTSNISDPNLITLEDEVTIGGSATLIAHYGMGGYLVLAPVVIKRGVTIGLRAIIMGGVEIGEGSKILPNSVVMQKTRIPPGEIWGGVPAQKISDVKKN